MTRPAHPVWCDLQLCTADPGAPRGMHRSPAVAIDPADTARSAYELAVHRELFSGFRPDGAWVVLSLTYREDGSRWEFPFPLVQAAGLRDELGAMLNLEGNW